MEDDKPLDLSALDPMRNPARWRAVADRTRARLDGVLEARAFGDDPLRLISSWRGPLLAAAATAVLLLIPAEIALNKRETQEERVKRLVAISSWPLTALPTGADFRRALGGGTP